VLFFLSGGNTTFAMILLCGQIQTGWTKCISMLTLLKVMKRTLAILFPIIVVLGFVALQSPNTAYRFIHPWGHQQVIRYVFKNQEIFDVMTSSPQVTAQRLHLKSDREKYDPDLLSSYDQDAPVTLTANEAQTLRSLLQSPWSYDWDVQTCGPEYGVVFRFQSHGHTVRVAVCYRCEELGVFDGDDDSSRLINDTKVFKPMRPQLVAIAREIFPNDKEIQGLK
jgi:hypothetical protein